MSWIYLLISGLMEILGVIVLKLFASNGKKIYLLYLIIIFLISFNALSLAMKEIPMSVAYAIWTGIGASGGVIIGILFFKESKNFLKLFFVSLIIACSVGLKLLA